MLHLSLLVASLVSVTIACKILNCSIKSCRGWLVRRSLQLLGLFMPFSLLLFFSLMNLPPIIEKPQTTLFDTANQAEWLGGLLGLLLLLTIFAAAIILNLARLGLLYLYLWHRTWTAPTTLQIQLDCIQHSQYPVQLRIVYKSVPVAFTVSLRPGGRGNHWIVVSSGLVQAASEVELAAVLRHELAHIKRGDFWVIWLAGFLRDAFFYLPTAHQLFRLLTTDKEFACDEIALKEGSHQLDLASILLKVWESTLDKAVTSTQGGPRKFFALFRPPGLIGLFNRPKAKSEVSLFESRITQLLEFGKDSSPHFEQGGLREEWLSYGLLFGSASLWLITVGLVNVLMIPFGCALSVII